MYKLIKPVLFSMDPEKAHHFVSGSLARATKFGLIGKAFHSSYSYEHPSLKRTVFGIEFKNPVGLAAGFDKNAEMVDALSNLGFGFIEIGTVTPRPQPGNDKPRMFRLVADEALINRMGFNNQGVDVAASRLKVAKNKHGLVIGGNIGKNKVTPNQEAVSDYLYCLEALYPYVDYFVVNVSSPNTPGLRELQEKEPLMALLHTLKEKSKTFDKQKPILLKIAPDLTDSQLEDIVEIVKESGTDGVIATNTTISREGLRSEKRLTEENGGVSGRPLTNRSTEVIRFLHEKSAGAFPIIGVGGIHSAEDAVEKIKAGASLVQVYTGFIYQGPGLIKAICKGIVENGL